MNNLTSHVDATGLPTVFVFAEVPFVSWLMLADKNPIERQAYRVTEQTRFLDYQWVSIEQQQVAWLIRQFNQWFAHTHTELVKGSDEPEYFAKSDNQPAKIVFAHGFFASGLHEISHWCVAGKKRRAINDFGYWYAPDGRDQAQQREFERVEVVPQAIECLFTLACGKKFRVSADNLGADFDTVDSMTKIFSQQVREQAVKFWQTGERLPTDAKVMLKHLLPLRPYGMSTATIYHNFL